VGASTAPDAGGVASGLQEGSTRLDVPPAGKRGPGRIEKDRPFYNAEMAANRDLSVLLAQAYADSRGRQVDFADVLAGAGARSLRVAHEVRADIVVHANDGDPLGIAALRRGRTTNQIPRERLVAQEGSAHGFMARQRYDIVDIDPFGSPAPFLDAAVRATRHDGLLCITATDTAALSGTNPKACRRRYAAEQGLHIAPWRAEVGLRILAGAAVRAAGRFERAARPLLSVQKGHWMRVVLHIEDGATASDRAAAGLGYAWAEPGEGVGHIVHRVHELPGLKPWAGPLWTGALHDQATIEALLGAAEGRVLGDPDTRPLLELLLQEARAPPFWLDPNRLRRRYGDAPGRDRLMQALKEAGFTAARTHLDPQGIRTDASVEQLGPVWASA
jgi:tRNA (guanine26-N2/guanine27-N2)-dimethyltransferase